MIILIKQRRLGAIMQSLQGCGQYVTIKEKKNSTICHTKNKLNVQNLTIFLKNVKQVP
jgi:hypothetical protein